LRFDHLGKESSGMIPASSANTMNQLRKILSEWFQGLGTKANDFKYWRWIQGALFFLLSAGRRERTAQLSKTEWKPRLSRKLNDVSYWQGVRSLVDCTGQRNSSGFARCWKTERLRKLNKISYWQAVRGLVQWPRRRNLSGFAQKRKANEIAYWQRFRDRLDCSGRWRLRAEGKWAKTEGIEKLKEISYWQAGFAGVYWRSDGNLSGAKAPMVLWQSNYGCGFSEPCKNNTFAYPRKGLDWNV